LRDSLGGGLASSDEFRLMTEFGEDGVEHDAAERIILDAEDAQPCTASDATPASEFELAAWEAFARLKVTVKVKVVPPPRRGATTMSPPIARASAFTDDSPSPAPPKRDAMLTLAWENGRNRRLISLSVSPIPLSEIANETATLPL
jgi:hypothetical protein